LEDLQKFTQSGIFGLKINHLATLLWSEKKLSASKAKSCRFFS
jgi:hypothetical protein